MADECPRERSNALKKTTAGGLSKIQLGVMTRRLICPTRADVLKHEQADRRG
jgi:hypothetical protein